MHPISITIKRDEVGCTLLEDGKLCQKLSKKILKKIHNDAECQEQLRVVSIQNDIESLQELYVSLKTFYASTGKFN